MLITQASAGGGGGGNQDAAIQGIADSLLARLPAPFDLLKASENFPVMYEQSMNTVLTQELERFNILTNTIKRSLKDLKLAIKGEILLSPTLEGALNSLKIGKIPDVWLAKSYPSLKVLGGYMSDLYERLEWFDDWSQNGIPAHMWISRFHFT